MRHRRTERPAAAITFTLALIRTAAMTLLLTLALAAAAAPAAAQEAAQETEEAAPSEGWHVESDINLTLTQNAYTENWEGGEAGALSWALNSNTLAENQLSENINNKNTLKLAFGQTHSQDVESKKWAKPSKTTDLIDFETVFRLTYGWVVDPFVSGRVESRFLDKRDPEKTRTLNPTTFTESVGIARVLIKEENREWSTRLAGAVRQHMDRDVLAEGASERETVTTNDGGLEFVSEFRTPLADGAITLMSDLTVFQALYFSESEELEGLPEEDNWKAPDVNWENTFSAAITKHLNVNLYLQLLYDKEIDEDPRLKETLSLGFALKLL